MDDTKKKRIIAVVAIVVAVAFIVASVVALVVTNASTESSTSQTQQVSDTISSGEKSTGSNENNDGSHEGSSKNSDGSHANSASSSDGNHEGSSSSEATSSSSSSSTAQPSTKSSESTNESVDDSNVTVYITIDAAAHGNVSYAGNVTLDDRASVYDALSATGISINARDSQYGTYVAAIGGLAEKSAGGESGWKYSVNGVEPQTSCSNYKLKSGDVVKWKFVTKASESIG